MKQSAALFLLVYMFHIERYACFQAGLRERLARGCKTHTLLHEFVPRRSFLAGGLVGGACLISDPKASGGAVGQLPELVDTNAILQGLTIRVADESQQSAMVSFLSNGFGFEILRQRIRDGISEIWIGFGPEQLSIPQDFIIPVSSFNVYGGHASICILYDPGLTTALYRSGNDAPGDNIAYLQVAVPGYRISQMVQSGANIIDAYGIVNVVSPSGLPLRGIVGFTPDPMMFVAINCVNIEASKAFYKQLGFVEQEYPFARQSRGLGPFEPPQPAKSVYLAPSKNSMGVLLLQSKKKKLSVNPVVQSLNVVYTPPDNNGSDGEVEPVVDPSGTAISFQRVAIFEAEEKNTR